MVAVGIEWFAEDLQLSRIPVVFSVGLLLTAAASGFLVHLVLAFPTGLPASRPQQLLAAATYLTVFAVVPFGALFADWRVLGLSHPPNLLLIRYDLQLLTALSRLVDLVGVVVAVGVVTVLVRRWMVAKPPMRWVLVPVFATGLVGGVASLAVAFLDPTHPVEGIALGVYKVVFVLLPLNRVVLVDDAVLIRDALAGLLRRKGFEVIAEVGDADSLTTLLGGDARGVGYLLKERVTGEAAFLDAVRRVACGGCAIDPEVVSLMLRGAMQRWTIY